MARFIAWPEQTLFFWRLANGEQIIYHHVLELLFVFTDTFVDETGMKPSWVSQHVPPGYYDLLISYSNHEEVVGVKFWTTRNILTKTDLVDSYKNKRPITVEVLLENCESLSERGLDPNIQYLFEDALIELGDIVIPESIITEMLDPSLH